MLIGCLYIFCELFPFPVQALSSLPFITSLHSQDPRHLLPPSSSIEGNNAESEEKGPDERNQVMEAKNVPSQECLRFKRACPEWTMLTSKDWIANGATLGFNRKNIFK